MAAKLGIGLVGCGLVGTLRARALRSHGSAVLRAVADVEPSRAEAAAAAAGGPVTIFDDPRRMLEAPGIDAVVVSTPVPLHEEMVLAALGAGKHVLCEKPLAATPEGCRRMLGAAGGRALAVGFNHRYFDSVKLLRRLLEEGRIGELDHLRVFCGHGGPSNFREDWMFRAELSGGGAMMDLGIHLTDLVRFLAGEIREVYGVSTNRVWGVEGSEDDALALFRSASGVPVTYQATWSEWRGYRFHVEAYGTRGMIRAAYGPMWNLVIERDGERTRRTIHPWVRINVREKLFGWETTAWRTFREETADLASRIEGRRVPLADGLAGLRAVEIAHAVYESSRTRAPVLLDTASEDCG